MKFYSNGKLLISGEYLALDGAESLALPTTFGQELNITETDSGYINWISFDENTEVWFQDNFSLKDFSAKTENNEISERLTQIFKAIKSLNPDFLNASSGIDFITNQDFNRDWGLGTSSTLINNMANWANVDAYQLLELTFGGSGYDIACAQNDSAIRYQLVDKKAIVEPVNFNPSFMEHLYFVYRNQKQNSRDGISNYRQFNGDLESAISEINAITSALIECKTLSEFNRLISEHENIISKIINQQPVKQSLFSDFNGSIKSLGAWGGDFMMVTSEDSPKDYFNNKGYPTIIPYKEMIKSN